MRVRGWRARQQRRGVFDARNLIRTALRLTPFVPRALVAADTMHHELISHLGRTHLLIEPFAVSTKRVLPASHPVAVLLAPHVEGTIFINSQ